HADACRQEHAGVDAVRQPVELVLYLLHEISGRRYCRPLRDVGNGVEANGLGRGCRVVVAARSREAGEQGHEQPEISVRGHLPLLATDVRNARNASPISSGESSCRKWMPLTATSV